MKRRLIRIVMLAGGGLVLLGIVVAIIVHHMGPGTIQEWIGLQIQDVANSYLGPKLSFTDLSYDYPLTVSLKNLHLTADDPGHPGQIIDIIACEKAVVSLAEIPSIGKPIVIEKIELDQPLISAVAVAPRSKKFVGFSDLLRGGSSDSTAPKAPSSGSKRKLSDVFRMRLVQITDGKIVYDPRIEGTVPMALDQINTTLKIEPAEGGGYRLDTVIARSPVFRLSVVGQLNLDDFSVRNVDVKLMADLGQDKLDYLPPELQAVLKEYDAKGKLSVEVTGSMPIMDPMKGEVNAVVTLDRANLATNAFRMPVDQVVLKSHFQGGKVGLAVQMAALGGTANLSGSATLNDRLDADMHLRVAGMVLERLLASPASAAPARLDLDLSVAGSLLSIVGKAPAQPGVPLAAIGLKDFRLWADDPVNAGRTVDVVACKSLDVAMTQPMISGRSVVIDKIVLNQLAISAVAASPGSMQFLGVPNIPAAVMPIAAPDASSPAIDSNAPERKPGDILRVKMFQLIGAKIIYDPRIAGTQAMCLDDINTSLNVDPDDPGSYKVSTNISRKPGFDLGIDGKVNIDDPGLQDLRINLAADLTRDNLDFLPPQLQLILKQVRAKGKLDIHAGATVALSNPMKGKAQFDLNVRNIELNRGEVHIPVDDFSMSARLLNGKILQMMRIAALNNVIDLAGSVTPNSRLDTDMTLKLTDIRLETVLAALRPNAPVAHTVTTLNGEIEVKSPVMVAMGAVAGVGNEPIASVDVRHLRLTADDPVSPGKPLDFLACDDFGIVLSELPAPGKPIGVDRVVVDHPAIRGVALAPGSNDLAGFTALRDMAASNMPSASAGSAPTTAPADILSGPKISNLIRLGQLEVTNASIYYDARLDGAVPMSLRGISTKIDLDSLDGDAYRFDALIPSEPDLNFEIGGRVNVDTMIVNPLTVDLAVGLGKDIPSYLLPQLQQMLRSYDPQGSLTVKAGGTLPIFHATAGDLAVEVKLNDVKATAGAYRIPMDHVRLPLRLKGGRVEFLDASSLGGATVDALGGTANLTGDVILNHRLDTSMKLNVDGMLLQDLMPAAPTDPKKGLIGAVQADVKLVNAPVLAIAAAASQAAEGSTQASATEPVSRPDLDELPANWGSADVEVTHARLAGLEVLQDVGNLAKSAFSDIFDRQDKDKPQTVVPKESANVVATFDGDHITIAQVHYEGEVVGADGKGYITLAQELNMNLTGGPISKLAGMGSVGNWIKNASDSLLYYHVSGTIQDPKVQAKAGDGKPIIQGAKKIVNVGVKGIGTGLKKTGQFFQGLFHHDGN